MAQERLQKIIARSGLCSRREAEHLIVAGRVRVNRRVVRQLGACASARSDRIEVDGRRLAREGLVYILLHKPRGTVSTLSDPQGRPTVRSLLRGVAERVYPVGRLDYHTSGALLMTNDGGLMNALLSPQSGISKVYRAKLRGHLALKALEQLRTGVELDDGRRTRPAKVFVLEEGPTATWLQIELVEGQNRQIHRMAAAVGHSVQRLTRVSFAGLSVEGLKSGAYRMLNAKEKERLRALGA